MLSFKYFSAIFFLSFFLVSCIGEQASSFSFDNSAIFEITETLDAGASYSFSMGIVEPNFPGGLELSMKAEHPIEICLQNGFINQGNLQSCNPGGYFLFNFTNSPSFSKSQADSNPDMEFFDTWWSENSDPNTEQKLFVLPGGNYFGTVRFVSSNLEKGNDTKFQLTIMWTNQSCHEGTVGTLGAVPCVPAAVVTPDVVYTLPATEESYLTYDLTAQLPESLLINIPIFSAESTQAEGPWKVSVYVNQGTAPDIANMVYILSAIDQTIDSPKNLTFSLPSPAPGVWIILVVNNGTIGFNYTVDATAPTCTDGRIGFNCSSTGATKATNVAVTKYTGTGNYDYYTVSGSMMTFGVTTLDADVEAPIALASLVNYPSNQSYQVVSVSQNTNFLTLATPSSVDWYIAVWANLNEDYYIWTNSPCPNNCQGDTFTAVNTADMHGTCDNTTGVCACEKNYVHLYCEKKGLSAGWIVLIVIAAAIILAVGIGVPVGFYLRTKSKARYERV